MPMYVKIGPQYAGAAGPSSIIVVSSGNFVTNGGAPYLSFFYEIDARASGGVAYPPHDEPGSYMTIPLTYPQEQVYFPKNDRGWYYETIPNNAENNAKYKDIAFDGFDYVPINKEYRVDKKSNTLIPGVGVVYGDYYLTGGVSLKDNTLFVSGHGTRHTPTYDGVTFWMTATVLIDGKVFAKEALKRSGGHELVPEHGIPIGSATFNLPEPVSSKKTQLLLEGSFNIANLEGNASMPSATFTQTIDIQAKLKNSN